MHVILTPHLAGEGSSAAHLRPFGLDSSGFALRMTEHKTPDSIE